LESSPLEKRGKIFVGALMIGILGLTLILLQQQFNEGDHRKAVQLLGSRDGGAQWSIGQELVARSKNGPPDCQSKILSSFRGTLEVICSTGEPQPYRFRVDLVRRSIEPLDEPTRRLMAEVDQENRELPASAPDAGH